MKSFKGSIDRLKIDWNLLEDVKEDQLNKDIPHEVIIDENNDLEYIENLCKKGELDNSNYMFINLNNN